MPKKLEGHSGWNVKKPLVEFSNIPKACDDFNGGSSLVETPIRIFSMQIYILLKPFFLQT
jgi:hypothetical protein